MPYNKYIYKFFGDNIDREYRLIKRQYHFSLFSKRTGSMAVFCMDSTAYRTGLADRLRGIISVYAWAKYHKVPFKIYHQNPFCFENYLEPNEYDWRTDDNQISYNFRDSSPFFFLNYTKGYRLLFLFPRCQYHFYTNIDALPILNKWFNGSFTYTELFKELFRPNYRLKSALDQYSDKIKVGYISISFRFINLLGDFTDSGGGEEPLPPKDRIKMIEKCIAQIDFVLNREKDRPAYILVTSDSAMFNSSVASIPYVFTIPGEIGHIGMLNNSDCDAATFKTFLDFYMISFARKAYTCVTGRMYRSHFAESAAAASGIPYEMLEF